MNKNIVNRCNKNIIVKSRISLKRNIKNKKFSPFLTIKEALELAEILEKKFLKMCDSEFKILKMREESKDEVGRYLEKGLVSQGLFNNRESGEVLYNPSKNLSVMINEGDHLNINAVTQGLNLKTIYKMVRGIDDELDEFEDVAFSEKFGYLTMNKNDIGTGLKVILRLHIPTLQYKGEIEELSMNLKKIDIKLQSVFNFELKGENSFYEISNIKSLGVSEDDMISNLEAVANEIILREKKIRDEIISDRDLISELEDEVFRAYGILLNARLMSFEESINLLSKIRLGIELNLLNSLEINKVDEIIDEIQYYNLKFLVKNNYNEREEKILRAKVIREELIS